VRQRYVLPDDRISYENGEDRERFEGSVT